jgi:hypothetical protein
MGLSSCPCGSETLVLNATLQNQVAVSERRFRRTACTLLHMEINLSWTLSLFPVAPTLEHRAYVKRFVSLQCLNPKTIGWAPWTGISPSQGRYLHKTTQTQNKRKQISMP